MTCLTGAQLADYWAADLADDARDAIEAHLFGCAACTASLESVARIVGALRAQIPPVIGADQLADLRARGLALGENTFQPGTRTSVTFGSATDLLIHHLAGLDLAAADRVEVTIRALGSVIFHDPAAPFDRARGEVLIACQRHFASFPPDVVFDVDVHRAGATTRATYDIPHAFG